MRPGVETFLKGIPRCACGKSHDITTRTVHLGAGVMRHLPEVLASSGKASRILVLFDVNTHKAAGGLVLKTLEGAKKSGAAQIENLILPEDVHADEKSLKAILDAAKKTGCTLMLAVGSGTINDLVKVAAHQAGLPYVCVATAASMDGYLSANATILTNGNKLPYSNIRPPIAVIADTGILRTAPERMTLAGLGDALGKITSLADWKLNHLLRGEHYCTETATLLREEVADLLEKLSDKKTTISDEGFMTSLIRALVMTGVVMQRLGNSTPASGGEHCVSHAMEMRGYALKGGAPSLHGLQVSVGLDRSLAAYGDFFDKKNLFDFQSRELDGVLLSHLREWESIGVDLKAVIETKIKVLAEFRSRFEALRTLTGDPDFSFMQKNRSAIQAIYQRFSLPAESEALGLSREELHFAVEHAVDVRPRLTIFDLHFAAGTIGKYR